MSNGTTDSMLGVAIWCRSADKLLSWYYVPPPVALRKSSDATNACYGKQGGKNVSLHDIVDAYAG